MPRKAIDYQKVIIYKLVCNDLSVKDLYVGHTTDFTNRKRLHKSCCLNSNDLRHNFKVYKVMRENGSWYNWTMIEIEKYPCKDENEARARERFWYEELQATLNSQCPILNVGERKQYEKNYYEKNKDQIKGYEKDYYVRNKDTIKEQKKYIVTITKIKLKIIMFKIKIKLAIIIIRIKIKFSKNEKIIIIKILKRKKIIMLKKRIISKKNTNVYVAVVLQQLINPHISKQKNIYNTFKKKN
jgi:hypothetical protein